MLVKVRKLPAHIDDKCTLYDLYKVPARGDVQTPAQRPGAVLVSTGADDVDSTLTWTATATTTTQTPRPTTALALAMNASSMFA